MIVSTGRQAQRPTALHLRLPATSANLGPGFDAVGLAMSVYLTIDAEIAETFHIAATGRDQNLCASLEDNLMLTTYLDVLANAKTMAPRLHLRLQNEIPLGMGFGSSASALAAGVLLANHFGQLGWSARQILQEAVKREGHPDNVAACLLGGMTISSLADGGEVITATCGQELDWRILVALPSIGLATAKARALLPDSYSRADAVANLQATALLVAAFAQNRPELLRAAMQDRLHQPYRGDACPLLPRLLPLAGNCGGVLGVALSGAGPSVLILAQAEESGELIRVIRRAADDPSLEVIETRIARGAFETCDVTATEPMA